MISNFFRCFLLKLIQFPLKFLSRCYEFDKELAIKIDELFIERSKNEFSNLTPKLISVIIPSYNEEVDIGAAIESASRDCNVEIIISDGGSTDRTMEECSKWDNIKLLTGNTGRSNCLNQGAAVSNGDILIFLHADSKLPQNYGIFVRKAIEG